MECPYNFHHPCIRSHAQINILMCWKKKKRKNEVDGDCSVCLEPLSSNVVTLSNCNHSFHRKCIKEWDKSNPLSSDCPLCRASIIERFSSSNIKLPNNCCHRRLPSSRSKWLDRMSYILSTILLIWWIVNLSFSSIGFVVSNNVKYQTCKIVKNDHLKWKIDDEMYHTLIIHKINAISLTDGCKVWLKDVGVNKTASPRSLKRIKKSKLFGCVTLKGNANGKQVWLSWQQRNDKEWSHWNPRFQIERQPIMFWVNVVIVIAHVVFMLPCIHRSFYNKFYDSCVRCSCSNGKCNMICSLSFGLIVYVFCIGLFSSGIAGESLLEIYNSIDV